MCSGAGRLLLAPARSALQQCGAVVPFGGVSYRLAHVSGGRTSWVSLDPAARPGEEPGRMG